MIDTKIEDWEWVKDVESEITNTVLVFDPPLDLKRENLVIHDILIKLHHMGVKYEPPYTYYSFGGTPKSVPILKYKIKNRFGKVSKFPVFYSYKNIHDAEELYHLVIDEDGIMEVVNSDSIDYQYEKPNYKIFNAYELIYG
jgi:hypothetical protein